MNKIIQINLSGCVIMMEEEAYEQLQNYLTQLRNYFSSEESGAEILNDIENRIAELFQEKLQKGNEHISVQDLNEVIASIGRPEDLNESVHFNDAENKTKTSTPPKRLQRNLADKMIGGVCSGIAAYLGIDPIIVRILFSIITLGGFGTGFILYLLLWILLPKSSQQHEKFRKLYRNPDDRILGGVASGLAAYLNTSVSQVRLIFSAPLIINILLSLLHLTAGSFFVSIGIGGITGTFALAYIILWIILPEAETSYQKMEMRGESINLERIRHHVKESAGKLEEQVKDWGKEVEDSAKKLSKQARSFSSSAGGGLLHAIAWILKIFIYLILGAICFSLLIAGISILFAGAVTWPVQQFFWSDIYQQIGFWLTLFLFLYAPVFFFFLWIIRRIIGVRKKSKLLNWSFGILWTLGWICLFWTLASIGHDFEHKEKSYADLTISDSIGHSLLIDQSALPYTYTGTWTWIHADDAGFDITDDSIKLPASFLSIAKSNDSSYHVRVWKYAYGQTAEQAKGRINKIDFSVKQKADVLDFGAGFPVGITDKYRGQHVVVKLLVPKGKSVRFTKSWLKYHHWVSVDKDPSSSWNHEDKELDYTESDHFEAEKLYTMGEDGLLYEEKK